MTPAARIAVQQLRDIQQRAFFTQQLNNLIVRFEDVNAIQTRIRARQIRAVRTDRIRNLQTIFLADGVVVRAVAACGMHRAGTGIERHVLTENSRNVKAHERVRKAHQFKLRAFGFAKHGVISDVDALHHALKQIFRHDQRLAFNLYQHIVNLGVQRDSAVRRKRPRGGGPDNQRYRAVDVLRAKFRHDRRRVYRVKGHVNRRRRFVVILHFRLGQRGAAVDAPVHRLGAFVQVAVADDFTERADDVGFGFEIHGQVRVRPVAEHAQTDKVFTLAVNLGRRVFTAFGAEFGRGEFLTRLAKLLLHFQFDRQTVAVPARHVRRVITGKPFGLHDNVFQNLVNRVTNMNAAIRIRRAVMQNEGFFAFFGCTDDAVEVIIGPTRQHSRFAFGEIAAHREPCFRQIQG
ncbi:alpha-L-glutamate ligases, RimK family [Cronobacter malonaticus 507]|nr:alpha-L-glutamate ligases, RimK family [Cronobacter malonaticus 507]